MRLRLPNLALAGAIALTTVFAPPASAEATSAVKAQTLSKIRALKRTLTLQKAQARIHKARLAARAKKKGLPLPAGQSAKKNVASEPGVVEHVRELQAQGRMPGLATSATRPERVQGGGAFGTNRRINDPNTDLFTDAGQSETTVAAVGTNILVAWNDGNGFDLASPAYQLMSFGYSTDGGTTWTDGGGLPQPPGFPNWQWTSDPVLAVNETTNEFIFTGLVFPIGPREISGINETNGIAVVKGTFSGSNFTWGTPVLITSGLSSSVFYDKQWHSVNPTGGNIYLTYTRFTPTGDQIEFRRSTDGGATWSGASVLSSGLDDGYVQGSRVAVGPNNEVYTVWQAIGLGAQDHFKMRKSTNAGLSFAGEVIAASYYQHFSAGAPGFNRGRAITYPGLAVDRTNGPSRGRVYLTWNESLNYYGDLDGGGPGKKSEIEPNNSTATATSFAVGDTVRGVISNNSTDLDFFSFSATQGQTYVFFVDSLSSGLVNIFRLICSDQNTRLQLSSPEVTPGLQSILVWTCPANGTYYLRPAANTDYSFAAPHPYRILTSVHTPVGSDRARDHRDIFVASSADGITWPSSGLGAPTLVNFDESPWFDDWLPEVAVTGHSRVFATWFDWRDSAPATCGGQSNLYLYRSSDAGASWTNLGLMTDATSAWTTVVSNMIPNQGDYVALFANYTGVYAAWGDGRRDDANLNDDPNVYGIAIPIATPTLASLATSRILPDRVELDWLASEYAGRAAQLERRESDGAWSAIGTEIVDGNGRVSFADATVVAGHEYTYRLVFGDAEYSRETTLHVPGGPTLALAAPQPNPVVDQLWLSFSLPNSEPATLSLLDISGRVVRRQEVGALGAGEHRVNLSAGSRLDAGVYVAVLKRGERSVTRRIHVVR